MGDTRESRDDDALEEENRQRERDIDEELAERSASGERKRRHAEETAEDELAGDE